MPEEFDKAYWEHRYHGHAPIHRREPNPQLLAEVGGIPRGTALDAGCGEGADAVWLAAHGWRVTAVDIAGPALARAREYAQALADDSASRIEWIEADLTSWTPPPESFDLVTSHYVHAAVPGEELFARLASAVTPGGTLLVVGHDASDTSAGPHAPAPGSLVTAGDIAGALDLSSWDIEVAEARERPASMPDGHELTLRDAVLRARKRR